MSKNPFIAFSLILVHLGVSSAQDYRARIQGIVTDPSAAVVAGAAATLVNINTGVRIVKHTNETGLYLFDYVEPGSYTLTVELQGFSRFIQENIGVQSRGDVTVNVILKPGVVQESVTVQDSPVAVQFNSTSVSLTIDTKLANELPRFDRNPFKLGLLDPAAINTRGEMNPYHSWAANSIELGGGTSLKNDLQVDGSPIGVGHKASYAPPPDAVQEVIVLRNSVDAESGHSAGGVISVTMKSGTNQLHGNVFYLGRNPALNALNDRTTLSRSASRNNMWGASAGHPILNNKLFNYVVYEQWKPRDPLSIFRTMPTSLERTGDFSQSRNIDGGMRGVYDPFSTVFDAASGQVTRTPFAGNRVPNSRFDPLSARLLGSLWEPNNPGDNITGLNNYRTAALRVTNYKNFSDRADWNINDQWKAFGRYSRIHTLVNTLNPTPNDSPAFGPRDMSARHALSISGDAVWTLNPSTVVNFHGGYHSLVDDYGHPSVELGKDGWSDFWPDNPWYKPFQNDLPVYHPRFHVGGSHFGQHTVFWYQHPNGKSFSAKISQQRGAHYWKAGFETRRSGGVTLVTGTSGFFFGAGMTADTFVAPNTRIVGHEYASFLLGTMDSSSLAVSKPVKKPRTEYYAGFFHDDFKLSRRLTLNLGLRYEFETAWHDPDYAMSRFLDRSQPIPEMQANPAQIPAAVTAIATVPYQYNGAWIFTDADHPGMWRAPKIALMPRAGLALRLDDRSSLRFGYARYVIPTEYNFSPSPFAGFEALNFLEPPYLGFDATQFVAPVLQGIPQARISDPFPAAANPLVPPRGKGFGRYLGLGGENLAWFFQDFKRGVNDRFNLSISRQLPGQIVAEVTLFANFSHDLPYTENLNMADPRLGYEHKGALRATVANPFFQYLTADTFPGPLRNQRTVSVGSLLRPYPQYGGLFEAYTPGRLERYQSVQIQLQRAFRDGYNFLFGYVYLRERDHQFFDEVADYLNRFEFQESASPRHRISAAGTYELPFGKGRRHLSTLHPVADAVLGGWQLVGAWYFNSGDYLRFGTMLADGNPKLDNPTPQRWFDTSKFRQQPADTPRTNPKQYSGLTGPYFWDLQGSVSKYFQVTERIRTEFKLAAYNATNRLNRNNPDLNVLSSTFGQALRQRGTSGRQVEVGLKILF